MKKILLIIILIIILVVGGIFIINNSNESKIENNIENKENEQTIANIQIEEKEINNNEYIKEGDKESRGFILDNTLVTENRTIHFNIHYPDNFNKDNTYSLYVANPGWEGLYFQGVGKDLGEPYPFEAQDYNKDMIVISTQLNDWGEQSANDCITLVEYFLNNYNIDKSRVYISGLSGGGETLSIVLGKKPELFTSALYISSQWDGNLEVLAKARTPLYMVIGENDSYYGSTKTKNAYNNLHKLYEEQGLYDEEIDKILVLDIKKHEYFTSKGYSDEHMGCIAFAYEENIMNWIFSKTK